MKKKVWVSIIVILSISIIWYIVPQYRHRTFEGVLFQLGKENAQNVQSVQIEIKGIIQRHFFSSITFKGTIRIDDELLPPLESPDKKLKVQLGDDFNGGIIKYHRNPETILNILNPFYYGILVFNKDFSKMCILKYEQSESGMHRSWSGGDGMVYSAPATNRTEALSIANELMGTALPNPLE